MEMGAICVFWVGSTGEEEIGCQEKSKMGCGTSEASSFICDELNSLYWQFDSRRERQDSEGCKIEEIPACILDRFY